MGESNSTELGEVLGRQLLAFCPNVTYVKFYRPHITIATNAASAGLNGIETILIFPSAEPGAISFRKGPLLADVLLFPRGFVHKLKIHGHSVSRPLGGTAIVYWGARIEEFIFRFKRFGWIIRGEDLIHPSKVLPAAIRMG
jgi:hypothetical protein